MPAHTLLDSRKIRDAPSFSVTAVQGLLTVETFLQEAMRYVPYCDSHRNVWSSHFTGIILEAGSQIDSIWKAAAKLEMPSCSNERLDITDHFKRFGNLVAKQKVIYFAGELPCAITPFEEWQNSNYAPLKWWTAYNALKHDRFTNQTEATLDYAVNAVAAMFLAVIYSGACDVALISANFLDPSSGNPWAYSNTGLLRDVTYDCRAIIETKLFAHPLGVFGVDDCNLSNYWMSNSPRFNIWWALNAERFTRPIG